MKYSVYNPSHPERAAGLYEISGDDLIKVLAERNLIAIHFAQWNYFGHTNWAYYSLILPKIAIAACMFRSRICSVNI